MAFTPYYAVIFTSKHKDMSPEVADEYLQLGGKMVELAKQQDGFIRVDSVHENLGITISYWKDVESIRKWKLQADHTMARNQRDRFYLYYNTRIAKVEREYEFGAL